MVAPKEKALYAELLGKLRLEKHKLKSSLGDSVRPCFTIKSKMEEGDIDLW